MNTVVKAGVALAVLVTILTVVFALTGLHKNPIAGGIGGILVAIALNIGAVYWALSRTAEDSGYGKQVLNGLLVGVVGGILIFGLSWLTMTVVFPDYLEEVKQANIEMLAATGLPDEQIQPRIESIEATTAVSQSFAGLIGTVVTSLILGAVIGIFKRKK